MFHSSSSWLSWKLGGGAQQFGAVAVLGRTRPPHGLARQWRAVVGLHCVFVVERLAKKHTIKYYLPSVAPFDNIDAA